MDISATHTSMNSIRELICILVYNFVLGIQMQSIGLADFSAFFFLIFFYHSYGMTSLHSNNGDNNCLKQYIRADIRIVV
jgi:hypothetical protein